MVCVGETPQPFFWFDPLPFLFPVQSLIAEAFPTLHLAFPSSIPFPPTLFFSYLITPSSPPPTTTTTTTTLFLLQPLHLEKWEH
jgi:hypothetical protein